MKIITNQPTNRSILRDEFSRRDGVVLLIVLVIIAMLSLASYSFTEIMISEAEATAAFGRDVQARALADSGIELVAAYLGDQSETAEDNFYHNPDLFQSILMRGTDDDVPRYRGRVSIVAGIENDSTATEIRFGLIDESAKLNINALVAAGSGDDANASENAAATPDDTAGESVGEAAAEPDFGELRDRLMFLPGMTEEIADAILDFIDEDDEAREYGSESDYYAGLDPPYEAKNAPLESLDELLLVNGVTPELMFGIDINRNGLIDASEQAQFGDPSSSAGLQESPFGWSTYLTVYSRESNLRSDGTARINLNHDDLSALYDQLEEEFGEDEAKFIIGYRLVGAASAEDEGQAAGSSSNSSSSGRGNARGLSGSNSGESGSGNNEPELKGGIDISGGAKVTINSIYDLIGVEVEIEVDEEQTTLISPWSEDTAEMLTYLPDLMDVLSTTDEEFIEGRLNVNQARAETLLGVPGIEEDLVNKIVNSQMTGLDGIPSADTMNLHATSGWLVIEGLADLETMRLLAPYLTAKGGVYKLQSVGYYDAGGAMARVEAVIDATQQPPRLIFQRDLSDLGRGFTQSQLNGP
ncbi:MAG: general secretion pathway protein GspK [Planctomycetes bacterium]|nr:general secretion pathway protein GspK [Planctomycetota bacterium]